MPKKNSEIEVACDDKVFTLVIAPVKDGGYVNIYGSDITERKKSEDILKQYRRHLEELVEVRTAELTKANEKLVQEIEDRKKLQRVILDISDREQRRIGQELHDGVGQQFTGIAFMMKGLEQNIRAKLPGEADNAAELAKLVNKSMSHVRSLARGLHPVELDKNGICSALNEFALSIERMFGINCTFKSNAAIELGSAETAAHVYRIAQESVTNAIKHAAAKNIKIELARNNGQFVLKVHNDGEDLPPDISKRNGMGLQIMNYRAEMIGGVFNITKADKAGAIVTCSFAGNK